MAKTRTKDGTAPDIGKLEAEKRELLVSKANPKRLEIVCERLDYIFYGIENKQK